MIELRPRTGEYMKQYLPLIIGIVLLSPFYYFLGCNDTPFKRGDRVTVQIDSVFHTCYCEVTYIKLNSMIQLVCDDGNKYEVKPIDIIQCGNEYELLGY